jgi:hypothetical protein
MEETKVVLSHKIGWQWVKQKRKIFNIKKLDGNLEIFLYLLCLVVYKLWKIMLLSLGIELQVEIRRSGWVIHNGGMGGTLSLSH